jgi:hypothetical protein
MFSINDALYPVKMLKHHPYFALPFFAGTLARTRFLFHGLSPMARYIAHSGLGGLFRGGEVNWRSWDF